MGLLVFSVLADPFQFSYVLLIVHAEYVCINVELIISMFYLFFKR